MIIFRKNFFWCVCFISSLVFTYYYFLYTNEYPPGSYQRIANFQADKVFQTRILITTIANLLEPSLPVLRILFQWVVPYPIDYEVILQLINVVFLFLLLLLIHPLAKVLDYEINPISSLFILIPISWNYIFINGLIDGAGLYYPYDIPSLTFFALGTILFVKKQWIYFYPVFCLACLNRESACFISIAGFFLTYDLTSKCLTGNIKRNQKIILQVFIQALLWFTSRICLSFVFRENPGDFFESPHSTLNFLSNILSQEPHWAMQNPLWFLSLFAGTWIIPLINWSQLNSRIKRFLIVGIIYLFTLTLRSNMMETRVYNELNIIIGIGFICSFFGKKVMKDLQS